MNSYIKTIKTTIPGRDKALVYYGRESQHKCYISKINGVYYLFELNSSQPCAVFRSLKQAKEGAIDRGLI